MEFLLQPTIAGATLAALAVAGGAPFFSDGLRAFRLRRQFERLKEQPLDHGPIGFMHTHGRVLLDSPLFSPLTGRPCAGYRLDVQGPGTAAASVVEERRSFRLVSGETTARIMAGSGRWALAETGRREIAPGEALSENLSALLARSADVLLLRHRNVPIVLTERALFAGAETHVVGQIRVARPFELASELEMMRTGTDDVVQMVPGAPRAAIGLVPEPVETEAATAGPAGTRENQPSRSTGPFGIERRSTGRPFPGDVDLWMDGGGLLDFVLVTDAPPTQDLLSVSKWRTLGLVLGPALSLTGLLYLAHAADQLHSQGRF